MRKLATRQAYDLLARDFGPGYNGPLQLVAQVASPAQRSACERVEQAVAATPGVVRATPVTFIPGVNGHSPVAIANVYPKGSPQAASPSDTTAIFADFGQVLSRRLPLFIGIVVLFSFLLLMAVFRLLLIPLTAAVNMLSAGTAFGVVTGCSRTAGAPPCWGSTRPGRSRPSCPC